MIPSIHRAWSSPGSDLEFVEVLCEWEGRRQYVIAVHLTSGYLVAISPKVK